VLTLLVLLEPQTVVAVAVVVLVLQQLAVLVVLELLFCEQRILYFKHPLQVHRL